MSEESLKIAPEQFQNKVIKRNGVMGKAACEILAAAINAVNPYQCVKDQVHFDGQTVQVGDHAINFDQFERVFVLGFGKASVPMAKALIDIFDKNITAAGVVTKDDRFINDDGYKNLLNVYIGDHPIPSDKSITATRTLLTQLPDLTGQDLIFVVISGGGSALWTDPYEGISLQDLQSLTDLLLKSGAEIQEINTLRKHLDQVKGGRLVSQLHPATICSLILSDVVGDPLDMIASGPTVPDPTTYTDAIKILEKYHLEGKVSPSILNLLKMGCAGEISETLKHEDDFGNNSIHHLVGNNVGAAKAAQQKALALGFDCLIISTNLKGLTSNVADFLDGIITTEVAFAMPSKKPACLIFGGETTVNVKGEGLGGRNQDLALRMVKRIADKPGVLFISLATDGEDGPTDAAGAASDAFVFRDGAAVLGLSIDTYIDTNNSYNYFQKTGGLIKIGSTGTNVNDLVIILVDNLEQFSD